MLLKVTLQPEVAAMLDELSTSNYRTRSQTLAWLIANHYKAHRPVAQTKRASATQDDSLDDLLKGLEG